MKIINKQLNDFFYSDTSYVHIKFQTLGTKQTKINYPNNRACMSLLLNMTVIDINRCSCNNIASVF